MRRRLLLVSLHRLPGNVHHRYRPRRARNIPALAVPAAGVAGGGVEAVTFGWVLARQLRAGDRGRALGACLLFTAVALAVLVVDALR